MQLAEKGVYGRSAAPMLARGAPRQYCVATARLALEALPGAFVYFSCLGGESGEVNGLFGALVDDGLTAGRRVLFRGPGAALGEMRGYGEWPGAEGDFHRCGRPLTRAVNGRVSRAREMRAWSTACPR